MKSNKFLEFWTTIQVNKHGLTHDLYADENKIVLVLTTYRC